MNKIICNIKIRQAPTRHDNVDFGQIVTKISKIKKLSIVVADKGYDSEDNHVLVRKKLHGFSIIPPRYSTVPVWKTRGKYRKEMKRGYNKILYNQRNKDETILSVIKRLFGEHISFRLIRLQNRELTFRCIAYNVHRTVKLVVLVLISTEPYNDYFTCENCNKIIKSDPILCYIFIEYYCCKQCHLQKHENI